MNWKDRKWKRKVKSKMEQESVCGIVVRLREMKNMSMLIYLLHTPSVRFGLPFGGLFVFENDNQSPMHK